MKTIRISCSSIVILLTLAMVLLMIRSYFESPKLEIENKKWLALLQNKKVNQIWLRGAKSVKLYNEVDTVRIDNGKIISKASDYAKDSKLIYSRNLNFKARSLACNAILISGDSLYQLPMHKFNDGRGMFDAAQDDSIYQNTKLVLFLDSIFQVCIKNK